MTATIRPAEQDPLSDDAEEVVRRRIERQARHAPRPVRPRPGQHRVDVLAEGLHLRR